jgi:hypothetical protein
MYGLAYGMGTDGRYWGRDGGSAADRRWLVWAKPTRWCLHIRIVEYTRVVAKHGSWPSSQHMPQGRTSSSTRFFKRYVQVQSDQMPKEVSASLHVVGIWECEDA